MQHVTIKNIAEKAGVSTAAVSKALNGQSDISEATRKRITDIARELGYTPNAIARNLVKKSSDMVGVVFPDITNPIYNEFFKALDISAQKNGIRLYLCDTNHNVELERSYVRSLMENRVMGIIVAPITSDISHITAQTEGRIPVVYMGGQVSDPRCNFVFNGDSQGTTRAIDYLFSLGHEKIAMVCDDLSSPSRIRRTNTYREIMELRGYPPRIVFSPDPTLKLQHAGYVCVEEIVRSGDMPTAIFAYNDMVAVGALQALRDNGYRVPMDVSVVGYDDIEVASLPMINLTTIAQPKMEMGELAIAAMLRLVKEGSAAGKYQMYPEPKLVIRNTSRDIRK